MLKLELVRLGRNCPTSKTARRVGKFQARKMSRLASKIERTRNSSKRVPSPPNLEHRESDVEHLRRRGSRPIRGSGTPPGRAREGDFQTLKTARVENELLRVAELIELDPIPDRDLSHLGALRQETVPPKGMKTASFNTSVNVTDGNVKTSRIAMSPMSQIDRNRRLENAENHSLQERPVHTRNFRGQGLTLHCRLRQGQVGHAQTVSKSGPRRAQGRPRRPRKRNSRNRARARQSPPRTGCSLTLQAPPRASGPRPDVENNRAHQAAARCRPASPLSRST